MKFICLSKKCFSRDIIIFIIAVFLFIIGLKVQAVSWDTAQTVHTDDSEDVGWNSSIAINPTNNYPAIAYQYDSSTGADLYYAYWDGSAWQTEVVDSDLNKTPIEISLIFDSSGNPHIAYNTYKGGTGALNYTTKNGSWSAPAAAVAGSSLRFPTIKISPADSEPRVVYCDTTDGSSANHTLEYAIYNGSSWSTETVVGAGSYCTWSYKIGLDFDASTNNPRIAYRQGNAFRIDYIEYSSGAWQSPETVASSVGSGGPVNLVIDSSGNPHIAYNIVASGSTNYAYHNGSSWSFKVISLPDTGSYLSLALDSSDNPHIIYYWISAGNLRHAWWDGSSWDSEGVVSTGDVGSYASLSIDSFDNPHIAYVNNDTYDDLMYITSGGLYTPTNDSLTFTNPDSSNIALDDDSTEWNFRAVVSDADGYEDLTTVKLRLADSSDSTTPYQDLEFTWTQSSDTFSETGADAQAAVTLSSNSASSCASNSCTLDFKIKFNDNFLSKDTNYTAELYTTDDSANTDEDSYADIYQVQSAVVAPSSAPTASVGTITSASIQWTYTDPNDNEDGFRLYNTTPTQLDQNAAVGAGSFTESSLNPNTQYARTIRAYNTAGESSDSNQVSAYTYANIPGVPVLSNASSSGMLLTLNANSNPSATEFAIYETEQTSTYLQANGALGSASEIWQTYADWGGASGINISGLEDETQYTFKVKARNSASTPVETGWSGTASVSTDQIAPSFSPVLSAGTITTSSIQWNYTDANDNEDGFRLYNTTPILITTNASSSDSGSFTESSLSTNTQYSRITRAYNNTGESPDSNTLSKYTLANVPGTPILSATMTINFKIAQNSNPSSTEYAIAISLNADFASLYYVQYQENGAGTHNGTSSESWKTYSQWGGLSGVSISNLSANTAYYLKVKARNGDNTETDFSASDNVSTSGGGGGSSSSSSSSQSSESTESSEAEAEAEIESEPEPEPELEEEEQVEEEVEEIEEIEEILEPEPEPEPEPEIKEALKEIAPETVPEPEIKIQDKFLSELIEIQVPVIEFIAVKDIQTLAYSETSAKAKQEIKQVKTKDIIQQTKQQTQFLKLTIKALPPVEKYIKPVVEEKPEKKQEIKIENPVDLFTGENIDIIFSDFFGDFNQSIENLFNY